MNSVTISASEFVTLYQDHHEHVCIAHESGDGDVYVTSITDIKEDNDKTYKTVLDVIDDFLNNYYGEGSGLRSDSFSIIAFYQGKIVELTIVD